MNKLGSLAGLVMLVTVGCGGGGGARADAASVDGAALDAGPDGPSADASIDGGTSTATAGPPIRLIVSGAKRLHGGGGLVMDVEVGQPFDQTTRTSGSIVIRGGAASLGN